MAELHQQETAMTELQRLRAWLATFPGFDILGQLQVDYTDQAENISGVFPAGLVELDRSEDILGNITVSNQYNFGLYCVLEKAPNDDHGALINAGWVMDFQRWVQEQSTRGAAPRFGNTEDRERASAQNGVLYKQEDGTAVYMVQLSFRFTKRYEVS